MINYVDPDVGREGKDTGASGKKCGKWRFLAQKITRFQIKNTKSLRVPRVSWQTPVTPPRTPLYCQRRIAPGSFSFRDNSYFPMRFGLVQWQSNVKNVWIPAFAGKAGARRV